MLLLLSILLAIIPLLGIVWTFTSGSLETVDGLFISLILLTLSGILMLNTFWEMRDRGYLKRLRRKSEATQAKKTSSSG